MPPRHRLVAALCVAALPLCVTAASAQVDVPAAGPSRYSVGVVGSVAQTSVGGTGRAGVVSARADVALGRFWVAEAAVSGFQGPWSRRWIVAPEAQLQLQGQLGAVSPYLGIGGGRFLQARRWVNEGVFASAALGTRIALPSSRVEARLEARGRLIGFGVGVAGSVEIGVGVSHRF